jgi:hypothetical protein
VTRLSRIRGGDRGAGLPEDLSTKKQIDIQKVVSTTSAAIERQARRMIGGGAPLPLPDWYPPKGFDLDEAARAIEEITGNKAPSLAPRGGVTIDVTDLDLTIAQTNRAIPFVYKSRPNELVKNPETGGLLEINYGPGAQREHELLELKRRWGDRVPWDEIEPVSHAMRTAEEVRATPEIELSIERLRKDQRKNGNRTYVVSNTGSEAALRGAKQFLEDRSLRSAGILSSSHSEQLARLGIPKDASTGVRKALMIAAIIRAHEQKGVPVKSLRFMEDKDETVRAAMELLPSLFPHVRFEIIDVVHKGDRRHEHVVAGRGKNGVLTDDRGRPLDREAIAKYESNDPFYAPKGFMKHVAEGRPEIGAKAKAPAPYRLMEGGTASFEPSGIAVDPRDPSKLLVLSDRWDHHLYRYELTKDGVLERVKEGEGDISVRGELEKYEALAPLKNGELLAVTPFNRPDEAQRRVLKLKPSAGTIEPTVLEHDFEALAKEVERVTGSRWFQIEGLCADKDGSHVFFGVRQAGESMKKNEDTVLIVRCPLEGDRIGPPEASFDFSTKRALGFQEGISDIQRDPKDGSYLITTSHEGDDASRVDAYGGHLFRIPAHHLEGPPRSKPRELGAPLTEFHAKPEGLAITADHRAVVVMDDDREWKDNFEGYSRTRAAYAVVDLG